MRSHTKRGEVLAKERERVPQYSCLASRGVGARAIRSLTPARTTIIAPGEQEVAAALAVNCGLSRSFGARRSPRSECLALARSGSRQAVAARCYQRVPISALLWRYVRRLRGPSRPVSGRVHQGLRKMSLLAQRANLATAGATHNGYPGGRRNPVNCDAVRSIRGWFNGPKPG